MNSKSSFSLPFPSLSLVFLLLVLVGCTKDENMESLNQSLTSSSSESLLQKSITNAESTTLGKASGGSFTPSTCKCFYRIREVSATSFPLTTSGAPDYFLSSDAFCGQINNSCRWMSAYVSPASSGCQQSGKFTSTMFLTNSTVSLFVLESDISSLLFND